MKLLEVLKSLLMEVRKLDILTLPSQGLFYKDDFNLKIKKADIEDVIEYEHKFDRDNLILVIDCIKKIVSKNVILEGYSYSDIKSVDIIYIFLEIVKFTSKKEIKIPYIDMEGKENSIDFGYKNFKYFDFSPYMKFYDKETKEMLIDGYRFSLPSIGIESSLTQYLSSKTNEEDIKKLNEVEYDFMFFLGDKNVLTPSEIDNLIQIFNFDIDDEERRKTKNIIDKFRSITGYSLTVDGLTIGLKPNLTNIWK